MAKNRLLLQAGSAAALFGVFATVGTPALADAVARHIELQDDRVMDEAIDGGRCCHRVFKDAFPFAEDQVAGDQDRAPVVALGD